MLFISVQLYCQIYPGRQLRRVRQVNRKPFLLRVRRMPLFMTPSQNTRRLSVELKLMTDTTGTTGISKIVLARDSRTTSDERIIKTVSRLSVVFILTTGTTGTTAKSTNSFLTYARGGSVSLVNPPLNIICFFISNEQYQSVTEDSVH